LIGMTTHSAQTFLRKLSREQRRLALSGRWFLLGYVCLTAGIYVVVDIYFYDQAMAEIWAAFLVWALGYLLLLGLMQKGGNLTGGRAGGVGTYFVLSLATGIPIALALVVLIVPGVYLMMRWLPVFARALVVEDWIGNTMRWSWNATQPYQKPLGISIMGPVACYGVAWAAYYAFELSDFLTYELVMIAMNVSTSVGSAWLAVLGIATFALVAQNPRVSGSVIAATEPA
jgi:hypothetical protein